MILKINGETDHYEIESLSRMLFHDVKLYKEEDGNLEDNFIEVTKNEASFKVIIKHEGKCAERFKENYPQEEETREIAKTLLDIYKEVTGKTLKWGILTGVRPIKFFRDLLDKGNSESETVSIMENKWALSEDVANFGLETALNQQIEIKKLSPNGISCYIGIPFCPSRCSYCTFVSAATKPGSKIIKDYLQILIREIEGIGKIIAENSLHLDTLYIGGGTPTILQEDELEELLKAIVKFLPMKDCMEFTVEGGRPDTMTVKKLETMKKYGVHRVSVNPQSMIQSVLDNVGRRHSVEDIYKMAKIAIDLGFIVNMDLIAGLEGDTFEGFCYSLDKVLEINPQNITVHSLTVKRGSRIYEENRFNPFSKEELIEKMIAYSREKLKEHGFNPYYLYRNKGTVGNLDNTGYERDHTPCLYNIVMMEEVQSVISAGAGSVTRLNKGRELKRIFSLKLPLEYVKNPQRMEENLKKAGEFYENCIADR